jgi:hypothetical protein
MERTPALTEAEINARVTEWHMSDGPTCPLHEYLGWTAQEYARWVESSQIPGALPETPDQPPPDGWPVILSGKEANDIADALLAGCFAMTANEHDAIAGSLAQVSAVNVGKRLRDAMLLLEGRIGTQTP